MIKVFINLRNVEIKPFTTTTTITPRHPTIDMDQISANQGTDSRFVLESSLVFARAYTNWPKTKHKL